MRFEYDDTIKISDGGNSVGVVLPKEWLEKMHVAKGDSLFITETPDGIALSPYDPDFAAQMEAAKRVMREDRNVLRALL